MQGITVELQDNYSMIPMFLLVLVIIAAVVFLIIWAAKEKRPQKKPAEKAPVPAPVNPRGRAMELKRKYDRLLIQLADEYGKNKVSERETYQRLSRLVRDFAFEMTGIKVQNYTLQELRGMNMPKLTALVEECYVPEFAQDNCHGDAKETINKARKVIGEWI